MNLRTIQPIVDERYPMLTIEQIQSKVAQNEAVVLGDPVLARVRTPLCDTFYPLGFPFEIETNCEEVLIAAAASWQGFVKLFDTPPLRLRVVVREGGQSRECPPEPICKVQHHLFSNIADAENFSICDLRQGFGSIWLSEAAIQHKSYLRYFFIEAAVYGLLVTSHATAIHAACVERAGCGILLCGDSGAGKSSLAYACARAGWTYVTDDGCFIVNEREDRLVVGNCNIARFRPSAEELFPELSGRPVTKRMRAGKPSIELKLTAVRNIVISPTSHVNHVVFLNRSSGGRQELVPFSTDVARYFMQQVLFSPEPTRTIQSAMIDRLLCAGAMELRYNDMNWAIDRLARLADEGRW
jgi:HPr Serine kinase C-terminal domain